MIALTTLFARINRTIAMDNVAVKGISAQSSMIKPGFLFVAKKGATAQSRDGHEFIDDAIKRGACALVIDESFAGELPPIPFVKVANSDVVYAQLCEAFYDFPSHTLSVIGITGTNGKTSTSFMLHAILKQAGFSPMVMGTLGLGDPQALRPVTHTTMEAEFISKELARAVHEGITHVVMEVSSHALALNRVAGLRFSSVGLTNITQDHLDFHGTLESYRASKARLFFDDAQRAIPKVLPLTNYFLAEETLSQVVRYDPEQKLPITLPLWGEFHQHNAHLAKALAQSLAIDDETIHQGLEKTPPVSGRLELVSIIPCPIFVDFAHTPDALERVLMTLTKMPHERIILVMGCGGDRDKSKRSIMGAIAEEWAHDVIITDDNPRHEDPGLIRQAILSGMKNPAKASVIADREQAIHEAITRAKSHDIVIIAGKGHENYQVYGDEKRAFCDQHVAKKAVEHLCRG